ncbi:AraC family transcriptional regulator [Echinicola sp. 20G]|uniref:helix-turn-helix domain-containing protein n=1 Tax=Echinicola sp. 20G TaxID=2781961 RepID=UPI0019102C71|nr:helix-turn-helix domain-containing protein [Echinicola sp. 20G]
MDFNFKKKLDDELVLKISRMKPVIKPTKPHKHAGYHELIFLSKGSGQHTIGDETFDVVPPTGFYLGPGQVHCWDFSKVPDGFVVLFKEEVLTHYPKALNCLFEFPKHFKIQDEGAFFKILEDFYHAFKNKEDEDLLTAFLNLVVIKSHSLSQKSKPHNPSVTSDFAHFKQLLNEHFMEANHAEEYAKMMNMSLKRLNKVCKMSVNATAREVIKERLLIEAKNLLTHTSSNVTEIAYKLNFTDSSNFVKFFKSLTTLTPLEYRSKAIAR